MAALAMYRPKWGKLPTPRSPCSTFFRSKVRSRRFSSFQRFGAYSGQVVTVSKTILSETDTGSPVQLREPAYKVVASLDRPDIDANGQKIPLQAGMLLRADILLERRELVRWLLDPILNVRM